MSNTNIIPTQAFLLVRMKDLYKLEGGLILPDAADLRCPYAEVIAAGPDCKFVTEGDNVLFLPGNLMAGFDQGFDEKFILPETAVFGRLNLEVV